MLASSSIVNAVNFEILHVISVLFIEECTNNIWDDCPYFSEFTFRVALFVYLLPPR